MIHAIIDLALRNRVLVLLLTVLVSLLGVFVYRQMPKDIYPDLNAPLVNIITSAHGMPSEEIEQRITRPMESLMRGTPHVTRVRSESATGESVVTVEFDWGIDIYAARQIVAGKLDIVAGQLPPEASGPSLGPVSSRMGEIFEFAVVGDGVEPMELRSAADWTIRYRLLGTEGVSFVINLGGFARQYQVLLDPDMLHDRGVTVAEVKEAVENSNHNFSGGIITQKNQELLIKGLGRIESLDHIRNTVITSRNGVPIYVKDVAEVKEGEAFSRGNAGLNGREAVSVIAEKQYGGDTLKTIDGIKQTLASLRDDLAKRGIEIINYYDQSTLIESSLGHVQFSILEGGALVFLVILLFLGNLRASLIASLTIPVSILFALVLMHLAGVTLTVMALGGLAIGVGKMAGGSVIMVENIVKFHQSDTSGASPVRLAAAGAKEIGSYLFSANIIILVFLPLLSLEGIAGRMFRPTVFALVAALLGSLIMNITLKPVLMSYALRRRDREKKENRFVAFATRLYVGVLKRCFRIRWAILAASLAVLVLAGFCYQQLGSEFVPFLDEGSMIASTVMLPETSLEESVRIGKRIEEIFLSYPEVVKVCRTTGMAEESEHVHPVNHSHYILELKPLEERERGYHELTEAMRQELDEFPGVAYIFEQPIANKLGEMLTGTEGQIALKVFGEDIEQLDALTREIGHVMSRVPGVADLQIEQTTGIPEVTVRLNHELMGPYGLQAAEVAELVETALNGVEVTHVIGTGTMTGVLLRLPPEWRQDVQTIENLLVDTPTGHRIPLSQIADIDRSEGPQTIFRENLTKRKTILCNVVGRDLGHFVEDAQKRIRDQIQFPSDRYYIEFGGQFESQQRTMQHLKWLMLVVGLSVLVVLFASLGSMRQSALLLLNVPMTAAGGIVALLLTGQTLNVSSLIGFIALFGIALQNGVILVGKINDLRREGMGLHAAVIEGAKRRFRPILMTELILILGVLPLALGTSSGSEVHRPLAVVYIGGFIVAIFFEQIVLPILYEMFSRLTREPAFE